MARSAKWGILGGVLVMGVMSQNLIPIHIAFIPLLVPPLIGVMNELKMDRRLVACAITFGIVTTYMFVPIGFGRIFLHDILYKNIEDAGLPVEGIVNPMAAMAIPAASRPWAVLSPCSSPTASRASTSSARPSSAPKMTSQST